MKENSFKTLKLVKKNIKVGDIIRIIDGSTLTLKSGSEFDMCIIYAYPKITGSNNILKNINGVVLRTGIKNRGIPFDTGCSQTFYMQDAIIQIGNAKFRIASKHVECVII